MGVAFKINSFSAIYNFTTYNSTIYNLQFPNSTISTPLFPLSRGDVPKRSCMVWGVADIELKNLAIFLQIHTQLHSFFGSFHVGFKNEI